MRTIFIKKTFLKSKRQPPNLKKLLTKTKFTNTQEKEIEVAKCKEPRFGLGNYIKEGFTFSFKGKSFKVNFDLSCAVKNAIYVIECRVSRVRKILHYVLQFKEQKSST